MLLMIASISHVVVHVTCSVRGGNGIEGKGVMLRGKLEMRPD
jgi:hypothetical protein